MIEHTLVDDRISSYLAIIEDVPPGYRSIFRGQGDSTWGLTPSLYRIHSTQIGGSSVDEQYNLLESMLIEQFFREGRPYLPHQERNYANDRVICQHFGVPTRLLDWTEDPLVALFFAVEDWSSSWDAAVFAISPDANALPTPRQVIHPSHQVIQFAPVALDQRVPAQRSRFTFHPYGPEDRPFVPLDERTNIGSEVANPNGKGGSVRGFGKIVVPQGLRRGLARSLLEMGIDRRNLFPGLDGVGRSVADRKLIGLL